MSHPLTYVEFLSVFVAVPAAVLAVVVARKTHRPRHVLAGVVVLVCIAVSYTAPWDSHLIAREVWAYGEGVVTARFARVPLGEWLFFGCQTTLTGLWYYTIAPEIDPGLPDFAHARRAGSAVWIGLAAVGAVLAVASARSYYLGMILVWATPVAAFLWAVGGPVIWCYRRLVATAVGIPSAYLWVADRFAIEAGLWTISPTYSSGIRPLGLPVEEVVFFLLTNVLVVQGLLLFDWTIARADDRDRIYALEGLVPIVTRVSQRWR